MNLTISIDDWNQKLDEILRDESVDFTNWDTIIDTLTMPYKLTATETGQVLIAAKERGLIDGYWPEHKKVLSTGGGHLTRLHFMLARKTSTLKNGREVETRKIIGQDIDQSADETRGENVESSQVINGTQSGNAPYVLTSSQEGISRSKDYLLKRVPRHIYRRLVELAVAEQDIEAIVKELKRTIDEMVGELG